MKKISTIVLAMLLGMVSTMLAVPANRKPVQVTQPDGTTITIQLHGDEWKHFTTTADGYTVKKNARGYYVYAKKENGVLKATQMVAHDANQRNAKEQSYLAGVKKYQTPEMSEQLANAKKMVEQGQQETLAKRRAASNRAAQYDYNNFRGLVVLVQFNDRTFSRDDYASISNDIMNQENYTGYENEEYTGSVRDYFSDNSGGKFKPEFDVVGPYTVNYSQYDCNMNNGSCSQVLIDALNQADNDVDFSDYDGDNNGKVDLVYFIIAGNGANYSGNNGNLWWPHRSIIYDYNNGWPVRKDGVLLWDYASSVELSGWTSDPSSVKIDGIGTICHEFSHVLGLPDFYDTDYEGSGGESNHPGDWSIMSGGSYFNDGRTPVGYSLYERYSVGFTDEPEVINESGDYTLELLYLNQKGYRLNTPNSNEFFLLENRQKYQFKWDVYLPASGMLVHRVELNEQIWNGNQVNVNPKHNYYELVRAGGGRSSSASDIFPGSKHVTELTNSTSPANLLTWTGKGNAYGLTNIAKSGSDITFTVSDNKPVALSLDENPQVGVGLTYQLTATSEPSYANYTLTWKSSNKSIATVDKNGLVKGISAGTCTITATTDNGIVANCELTVYELPHYTIAEFKQQPLDNDVILQLNNTEVLFAYKKNDVQIAYLRDATGAIMLYDAKISIKTNDILNGTIIVKTGLSNKVPQAIGIANITNQQALTITAGTGAEPREVHFEDLTEADYSDLVVVKATKLERSSGIWAYNDKNRARVWNGNFGISTGISSKEKFSGKYYDVTAIYGTDIKSNRVINELNVVKAVEEVEDPTGISELKNDNTRSAATYNMAGQRVSDNYKGLVIVNGKKVRK